MGRESQVAECDFCATFILIILRWVYVLLSIRIGHAGTLPNALQRCFRRDVERFGALSSMPRKAAVAAIRAFGFDPRELPVAVYCCAVIVFHSPSWSPSPAVRNVRSPCAFFNALARASGLSCKIEATLAPSSAFMWNWLL